MMPTLILEDMDLELPEPRGGVQRHGARHEAPSEPPYGFDRTLRIRMGTKANRTENHHIPPTIDTGLGELAKHETIVSKAHGSSFRLAVVLTVLPLQGDESVDSG